MSRCSFALVALSLLVVAGSVEAQPTPELVLDASTLPDDASIRTLASANDRVWFLGKRQGRDTVFVSDGTLAGSRAVAELPLNATATTLQAFDDSVLLTTSRGTLLMDLGGNSQFIGSGAHVGIRDDLIFQRGFDADGSALFVTDATATGLQRVADTNPGGDDSITLLGKVDGKAFFLANTPANGKEPWVSDGTEAGTVQVAETFPGSGGALQVAVNGAQRTEDLLVFYVNNDFEVPWVTDGTPGGTGRLADLAPNAPTGFITVHFRLDDGRLVMVGSTGTEITLFVSPTGALADLAPLDLSSTVIVYSWEVVGHGNTIFFTGSEVATSTNRELWSSDGTVAGTALIADLTDSSAQGSFPRDLTAADNGVYFWATNVFDASGYELYFSDGTPAGTGLIQDYVPGSGMTVEAIAAAGSRAVVLRDLQTDYEVLLTDATTIEEFVVAPGNRGDVRYLAELDGTAIVSTLGDSGGYELWAHTPGSTPVQLSDDLIVHDAAAIGGTLYMSAQGNGSGADHELWKTDGTAAGTVLAANVRPVNESDPYHLFTDGASLYFTATLDGNVRLPFQLDPSDDSFASIFGGEVALMDLVGDRLVHSVRLQSTGTALGYFSTGDLTRTVAPVTRRTGYFRADERVYFESDDGTEPGPWVWNLTDNTAEQLAAPHGGDTPSVPHFAAHAGAVYFVASTGDDVYGVWRTDGTAAGTTPLALPGTMSRAAGMLSVGGELLLFGDLGRGMELYRLDPSSDTFVEHVELNPDGDGALAPVASVGPIAFFVGNDGVNGPELAVTDGRPEHTIVLAPIQEGALDLQLEFPVVVGDWLYFAAEAEDIGQELHRIALVDCIGGACCDPTTGAVRPAGTECRASTGACDPAESCNGTDTACPDDALSAAGELCRAAANACDLEEVCSGSEAQCPGDQTMPACCTSDADCADSCDTNTDSCDVTTGVCSNSAPPAEVICDGIDNDCDPATPDQPATGCDDIVAGDMVSGDMVTGDLVSSDTSSIGDATGADATTGDATLDGDDLVGAGGGNDGGCCTTVRSDGRETPWAPLAALLTLLGLVGMRRRH